MQNRIDDLTNDLLATASSVLVRLPEAAQLAGCGETTIRRAIWRGDLTGSRAARNGPITIRVRELARWIIDGEKRSLPELDCGIDDLGVSDGAGS